MHLTQAESPWMCGRPRPRQGTDEATAPRSAPAHCGHAPGSRSGLWTRAERSPDLPARQRSEGLCPGGGGGGVDWLRVRGPLHSRRGSREAAGGPPLQGSVLTE